MASYYFTREQKAELNEKVTAMEVARYLGVPMKDQGKTVTIRCPLPGHPDEHLGTCHIYKSRGNCYCFACRQNIKAIDLMQLAGNMDLYEAVTAVASLAGVLDQFISSGVDHTAEPKRDPWILTPEERQLLGFPEGSVSGIVGASDTKPAGCYVETDEEYLLLEKITGDPLNDLLREDRTAYRNLVLTKLLQRQNAIYAYAKEHGRDNPEVRNAYVSMNRRLRNIAERFQKKE